MQCLFELCTPRTHGAPDSEREKTNKQKNKHHIFALTALQHCAIFPKLCVVIEHVETIKKVGIIFDPTHSFSYEFTEKFGLINRRAVSQQ